MRADRAEAGSAWFKQAVLWSDVAVFLLVFGFAVWVGRPGAVWVAGLVSGGLGFGLWMLARFQLGRSFAIGARADRLVGGGLYRYFRHPIYLFGGLAFAGTLVALQNWWILAAWISYAMPIQWCRARSENRVLKEKFGERFLAHRQRTWF